MKWRSDSKQERAGSRGRRGGPVGEAVGASGKNQRPGIANLLIAVLAGSMLLAACGGGEDPADEATKQRLENAYAALEQAAAALPPERRVADAPTEGTSATW